MTDKKDKVPDNVAENKALLPYGDSVSAPAIKVENIEAWKQERLPNANHYFKTRFEEIKKEYLQLMEEFKWNDLVYKAEIRMTPVKGQDYHLYQRKNEELFLSILAPNEWNQIYVASFRLDTDDKWEKIDWNSF